jgi:hypothetical protein
MAALLVLSITFMRKKLGTSKFIFILSVLGVFMPKHNIAEGLVD